MNEVFLCLGGNLGDRKQNLNTAKALIEETCGKITVLSKIYETQAWGSASLNAFLNQVLKIETSYKPEILLRKLLAIEKQLGRVRTKNKNGDRIIDIDILFFNKEVIDLPTIQIPHPRLHLRKFVLQPLNDIAKTFIHPSLHKTTEVLLKACKDPLSVREFKQGKYICIEGNIGSGKTTLAKKLAANLKYDFLPEEFEKNDLLPLFYSDPKTFAFPLEYSFLLNRFQCIADTFKQNNKLVVSDYSINKCLWFAKVNLPPTDYLFFKKHFRAIESQVPKPDLIVYLDTSTKNLKKNINARGRSFEKSITETYLTKVGERYLKGLKKLKGVDKIIIPVKNYTPQLNEELIKTIKNHLL